jgi:hypothetical protein
MKKLFSLHTAKSGGLSSLLVAICFIFCLPAFAQTTRTEVLTNASIVKLAKVDKFPPDLIKGMINKAPCNFSTSVDSVRALRSAGISDDIIVTMLNKDKTAAVVSTPAIAPKELWGTLTKDPADKKGKRIIQYISKTTGKIFKVGENIEIGNAGRIDGKYYDIQYSFGKFHNTLNEDGERLSGNYIGQTFTIEAIDTSGGLLGMFSKKSSQTVYIYANIGGTMCEIYIEAALAQKEVL